ncbi:M2 family metallopeptidase [Bythopirellula polymerisocia]|uniref:Peptidase family M3 n=1 Tax=Bythopirellula polymerisocia TaxID=2528003 RepID=A0A5C6CRZ7_9BACT|nr:M2 family metallopeptidase [Bythopirellula polymerisocia]TWU27282.1 Peptidase family M3 [Bythopirellula polymerisocia]
MTNFLTSFFVLLVLSILWNCSSLSAAAAQEDTTVAARDFVRNYETTVVPIEISLNRAWWEANTSGSDEAFANKEALDKQMNELLSSPGNFEKLKSIKAGTITDPQLARQIEVLYLIYLNRQGDLTLLNRMSAKANEIEKKFNQFRATVGKKSFTDSQVRDVLLTSKDSVEREQIWKANKDVGTQVAVDLRELVRMRNEVARKLGFKNYHDMQLTINEQDQAEVLALFDELDDLTRGPYARAKDQIDTALADQYGLLVSDLQPWHYQDPFFQEPPAVYEIDLGGPFSKTDILQVCREFYAGIKLPIEDVLEQSDLYEKPKKSPHAFCTDIDRAGDVRVLANIVPNEYWMSTMLHELGHSVYSSKYIPMTLPYLLRVNSHILTTEGVAMMFERFATDPEWLKAYGVDVDDPATYKAASQRMRRDKLLIFSRWCQVMLRFEMAMYEDPDQDLNQLWWDLVEKYQLVQRPEGRDAPDFASKIHVVSAPCYYHNYMMGELFACQVHAAICRDLDIPGKPANAFYTREPRVGKFMQEKIFDPGAMLPWNELTKHATGEHLNAKSFAAEFQ